MEAINKIRQLRSETGLNRKKFSEVYGIPVRTLEEWEAGRRNPPEYVVRMLSYVVKYRLVQEDSNKTT